MVGLAQLVSASGCGPEGRGFESHISPQKILVLRNEDFSFVPSGTTSFAWHTQHHLTGRSTSLPLAAQMNEVALRANDVMLRINDVALGANGMFQAQKSLISGGRVFRGKKPSFSPLHLSLNLMDLNLRLLLLNCLDFYDTIYLKGGI